MKLEIVGSVLENYETIKNFKEQNELTCSELYLQSNLSQNQIEAWYTIYKCLKSKGLEKFALINEYKSNLSPIVSYPESNIC